MNDPPRPPYPNAPPWSRAAQPPTPPATQPQPILNPPVALTPQQMLVDTPVGVVYPGRGNPGNPPQDGRTTALKALGAYLTSLTYCRAGAVGGSPVFFAIPPENFFVDRPGDEVNLPFPSIAVASDEAPTLRSRGFAQSIDNSTRDLFGYGTALLPMHEVEETVTFDVWSSQLPELHGIMAKVQQSFSPTLERQGFLLTLADYYYQTARFMLEGVRWPEDGGAVKNRRTAQFTVFMAFDEVRLVNYVQMLAQGQLDTETPQFASPQVPAFR